MKQLKKITLTLAALLTTTAGAWAQESNEITLTPVTGQQNQWTFTMPAGNVELTPIYAPELTAAFKAGNSNTIQGGKATVTVTESDGTTAYTGATLDENGNYKPLYEGQTITLTAAAGYKFKNVSVEKKGVVSYPLLSAVTAEDLGKIAGADGKIYDTKAAAEAAGTTAVAMIAYVGSETGDDTYTHGLAIALANEAGTMNWLTAKSTCEGKSAVTNAAWQLPSQNQWKAMFKAFGNNDASYSGLNTAITNAGGTALQEDCFYWSSTLDSDSDYPFRVYLNGGDAGWLVGDAEDFYLVRACLAF